MAKADVEVVVKGTDKASGVLSGISNKMQGMSNTFRKAGTAMMGAGVALGAGLFALANKTATMGDEIAKMSKRTGWAVESLSELRHVAAISGTSLNAFEKGTRKLSMAIVDAAEGGQTYEEALNRIGLTAQELIGIPIEEQFWTVANALAGTEDETIKAATAMELFGRTGTELFPMLEEGQEGIARLREEAHELGIVFNDETAKEAEEMKDAMTRLETSLSGVAKELVTVLLPDITKFAEKAVEIIKDVKDWIALNPQLVTGLKILVGVLVGGGGLLLAFSTIAKAITAVNAALIILHALSGIGLIKLVASLAIAAGAIAGMMKLLGGAQPGYDTHVRVNGEWIPKEEYKKRQQMHGGGVVAGPIGQPTPVMALGGEVFGGGGNVVNVTVQGSVITENQLTEIIYEKLLQRKSRNYNLELA